MSMLASAMTKRPKGEPWETTIKPYQNGQYVSQVKYDGVRVIVSKMKGQVRAWSRPKEGSVGLPRILPPHIQDFCEKNLPEGTFDGELVFGETGKSYDVGNLEKRSQQSIVFFDVLRAGQQPLTDLPFYQRYQLLKQAICYEGQCVTLAQNYEPSAEQIKELWDKGAEGVILKEKNSPYKPGWRSPDWLKIKIEFYTTGTVTGYEAGKNGPHSKVLITSDEGVKTSLKAKDNSWLKKFNLDPDKYIGMRVVFKHYGPTPDGKYRGPIIWDHVAGEGE
jgi:ATP-dependent DNA ligase